MLSKFALVAVLAVSAVMAASVPQQTPASNLPDVPKDGKPASVPGADGKLTRNSKYPTGNGTPSLKDVLLGVDEFSNYTTMFSRVIADVPDVSSQEKTLVTLFVPINSAFDVVREPWQNYFGGDSKSNATEDDTEALAEFVGYHTAKDHIYDIGRFPQKTVNAITTILENDTDNDPRLLVYNTGADATINCVKIYAQPIVATNAIVYPLESFVVPWTDNKIAAKIINAGKYISCEDIPKQIGDALKEKVQKS
ncbi:hypothetical protein THASP1DRAFT_21350 [Thamnocephalis sphaerospora]|uniref:FAS1 domain-containing protein n=1 Tax=Thamnocephalis sphaerospora TaxID=78915 RepID=A0A4V1IXG9_9FUNG|nr:hypothetical protein THASP1DRAFT_21350 [Thamnocephalis sphaerospora]|eukprot:RKP11019.1 hypothetical protein THASP1DRAFT_21350 [Thamnocephalis sphaerospora]